VRLKCVGEHNFHLTTSTAASSSAALPPGPTPSTMSAIAARASTRESLVASISTFVPSAALTTLATFPAGGATLAIVIDPEITL
jgi:hypothetical protein